MANIHFPRYVMYDVYCFMLSLYWTEFCLCYGFSPAQSNLILFSVFVVVFHIEILREIGFYFICFNCWCLSGFSLCVVSDVYVVEWKMLEPFPHNGVVKFTLNHIFILYIVCVYEFIVRIHTQRYTLLFSVSVLFGINGKEAVDWIKWKIFYP